MLGTVVKSTWDVCDLSLRDAVQYYILGLIQVVLPNNY